MREEGEGEIMGCTIQFLGKTEKEVKDALKKQIKSAWDQYQLEPDSEALAVNPKAKIFNAFKVILKTSDSTHLVEEVKFRKVKYVRQSGTHCAIGVTKAYGPKTTKKKPWLGIVHVD